VPGFTHKIMNLQGGAGLRSLHFQELYFGKGPINILTSLELVNVKGSI